MALGRKPARDVFAKLAPSSGGGPHAERSCPRVAPSSGGDPHAESSCPRVGGAQRRYARQQRAVRDMVLSRAKPVLLGAILGDNGAYNARYRVRKDALLLLLLLLCKFPDLIGRPKVVEIWPFTNRFRPILGRRRPLAQPTGTPAGHGERSSARNNKKEIQPLPPVPRAGPSTPSKPGRDKKPCTRNQPLPPKPWAHPHGIIQAHALEHIANKKSTLAQTHARINPIPCP